MGNSNQNSFSPPTSLYEINLHLKEFKKHDTHDYQPPEISKKLIREAYIEFKNNKSIIKNSNFNATLFNSIKRKNQLNLKENTKRRQQESKNKVQNKLSSKVPLLNNYDSESSLKNIILLFDHLNRIKQNKQENINCYVSFLLNSRDETDDEGLIEKLLNKDNLKLESQIDKINGKNSSSNNDINKKLPERCSENFYYNITQRKKVEIILNYKSPSINPAFLKNIKDFFGNKNKKVKTDNNGFSNTQDNNINNQSQLTHFPINNDNTISRIENEDQIAEIDAKYDEEFNFSRFMKNETEKIKNKLKSNTPTVTNNDINRTNITNNNSKLNEDEASKIENTLNNNNDSFYIQDMFNNKMKFDPTLNKNLEKVKKTFNYKMNTKIANSIVGNTPNTRKPNNITNLSTLNNNSHMNTFSNKFKSIASTSNRNKPITNYTSYNKSFLNRNNSNTNKIYKSAHKVGTKSVDNLNIYNKQAMSNEISNIPTETNDNNVSSKGICLTNENKNPIQTQEFDFTLYKDDSICRLIKDNNQSSSIASKPINNQPSTIRKHNKLFASNTICKTNQSSRQNLFNSNKNINLNSTTYSNRKINPAVFTSNNFSSKLKNTKPSFYKLLEYDNYIKQRNNTSSNKRNTFRPLSSSNYNSNRTENNVNSKSNILINPNNSGSASHLNNMLSNSTNTTIKNKRNLSSSNFSKGLNSNNTNITNNKSFNSKFSINSKFTNKYSSCSKNSKTSDSKLKEGKNIIKIDLREFSKLCVGQHNKSKISNSNNNIDNKASNRFTREIDAILRNDDVKIKKNNTEFTVTDITDVNDDNSKRGTDFNKRINLRGDSFRYNTQHNDELDKYYNNQYEETVGKINGQESNINRTSTIQDNALNALLNLSKSTNRHNITNNTIKLNNKNNLNSNNPVKIIISNNNSQKNKIKSNISNYNYNVISNINNNNNSLNDYIGMTEDNSNYDKTINNDMLMKKDIRDLLYTEDEKRKLPVFNLNIKEKPSKIKKNSEDNSLFTYSKNISNKSKLKFHGNEEDNIPRRNDDDENDFNDYNDDVLEVCSNKMYTNNNQMLFYEGRNNDEEV